MQNFEFFSGGIELLDSLQSLWEKLNQHHAEISTHFSDHFKNYQFSDRKNGLLEKSQYAKFWVELVKPINDGKYVGYCIASATDDGIGEIESIYLLEDYRNLRIGDRLMKNALAWLDSLNVHQKMIGVVSGNERAFSFYLRFGFYPRVSILKQKDSHEKQ